MNCNIENMNDVETLRTKLIMMDWQAPDHSIFLCLILEISHPNTKNINSTLHSSNHISRGCLIRNQNQNRNEDLKSELKWSNLSKCLVHDRNLN